MSRPMIYDRKSVRLMRETEFSSCFLMGLGFGMIAETSNPIDAFIGTAFCVAGICLMVSARQLREMTGDVV